MEGIAIPGKAWAAEEAGAAACVFANADEHVHEMIVSTLWGSPTPETRTNLPCVPMVSVGAAGAKILRESLEEPTPPTIRLTTRVSTGWKADPHPRRAVGRDRGAGEVRAILRAHRLLAPWGHGQRQR